MWRHLSVAVLVFAFGCEEKFKPPPKQKAKPVEKDNIVKVTTAVPYGKTVPCSDIFEPDKVGTFLNDLVEIKDRTESTREATAVCAIMRSGEPPKDATELKDKNKNQILGVLPGDEYCTISLYCSRPAEMERFKKKCEERGDEGNRDLGQYACVHKSQRAAKYAYTYRTIQRATKCHIEVMGGPSVTDEPLVQNCTKAALELLEKANLKNFK
jgi:hypothetical protein